MFIYVYLVGWVIWLGLITIRYIKEANEIIYRDKKDLIDRTMEQIIIIGLVAGILWPLGMLYLLIEYIVKKGIK